MSTTQPIRNKELLQNFKNYYLEQRYQYRNYTLIMAGLNTALRINDILHLTWDMVYDCQEQAVRSHVVLTEQKTGKENRIFLNQEIRKVLTNFLKMRKDCENPYVFYSNKSHTEPLSRYQAYRIVRRAARSVGLDDHISCHSLRKTFGYHAWKQGTPPALLMSIYNHSSYQITRHYLCIEQDDKDEVFNNIVL